jgi:mono/diheme cytochrome c family protein
MKKIIVIFALTAFVVSCAKKATPTASGSGPSSIGNSGTVISGANAGSSSGSTAAAVPAENTGTKTPATPSTNAAPEVQGQSTYNAKCGKCHGLKVVGDYTADRWAGIMAVMGPKAHLNDVETANVMAYVKANAKK